MSATHARRGSGDGHASSSRSAGARARAALLAAALTTLPTCFLSACFSCPPALELVDARLDTPRNTVLAFQTFLRADLYREEFKCFSQGFARSFDPPISYFTYAEARDRLRREQPWFKLFAKAEILSEEVVDERRHGVVVAVAGGTWRVNLVREDFFQIRWGEAAEESARAPLEKLVQIERDAEGGAELVARLPLRGDERALSELSSATLERLWKIDSVVALEP